ncbi:MAG: tyrosine-type recombinase/integrase [Proteobacteria bacterium]|nr:tyrosine-type recombinase/integrase [Pseudomonadota bacterium]
MPLPLTPHALSGAALHAVQQLQSEGEARNSVTSYRCALRYWAGWFALRYGAPIALPVPVAAVMQFIVDHAERTVQGRLVHELPSDIDDALVRAGIKGKRGPLALTTIVHRVAVLSHAHRARGHSQANPCTDPRVRQLLASLRRAYARRGALPHKKDALTRAPLMAALATCDASLRGTRDRALLLFAWSTGGRRRSEVAAADMAFLTPTPGGEYSYCLAHSKTNQAGQERPENHKPLVGEAASAMRDWLAASGIASGRIFRCIGPRGCLGESLSADAVGDIVHKHCALAGLSGDFTAHSLRSGFVTQARDMPLADVMALTGHRSAQSVLGYTRCGAKAAQAVARSVLSGSVSGGMR